MSSSVDSTTFSLGSFGSTTFDFTNNMKFYWDVFWMWLMMATSIYLHLKKPFSDAISSPTLTSTKPVLSLSCPHHKWTLLPIVLNPSSLLDFLELVFKILPPSNVLPVSYHMLIDVLMPPIIAIWFHLLWWSLKKTTSFQVTAFLAAIFYTCPQLLLPHFCKRPLQMVCWWHHLHQPCHC